MLPILTPSEMGEVDAAAPEPVEVLIGRAGGAVARAAIDLLGGAYGRRVVVLAGKGNNGKDGIEAARRLRARGARVQIVPVADAPGRLAEADLVIDAAFGTGFRGSYDAPEPGRAAVLAVDIPSGIDGITGKAAGRVMAADVTVTFASLKPGLVFADGRAAAGEVELVDIGLDPGEVRCHLVDDGDVGAWIPSRPADSHKWDDAVLVVAGSPGMGGAAWMTSAAAQRAGAGMVRALTPGTARPESVPVEVVGVPADDGSWAEAAVDASGRVGSIAVGPGFDPGAVDEAEMRRLLAETDVPVVIDGGALAVISELGDAIAGRGAATVITPHDGEFRRVTGEAPGDDRIAATREAATRTGAVVLLKGPTTVVAAPDGRCLVMADGDERLATAGSGDVLTGIIAALLCRGVPALEAAGAGAKLHAAAADLGPPAGLVASDLIAALPGALWDLS